MYDISCPNRSSVGTYIDNNAAKSDLLTLTLPTEPLAPPSETDFPHTLRNTKHRARPTFSLDSCPMF